MIKHVRTFVNEVLIRAVGGFDNGFERFLTEFLGHLVHAFFEEACRIGAFGHFLMAFVDEVLQEREEENGVLLVFFTPAGVRTQMAGGTVRMGFDQQGIVVAIAFDADQVQEIA